MAADAQQAIQALLQSLRDSGEGVAGRGAQRVVCVSRDHGSGGDEIARLLAEKLAVPLYDSNIVELIAERTHSDPEAVRVLDEGTEKARDMWLYSLFTGQDLTRDTYKRHLVNVILGLGRLGGVIIGRGAHVVLAKSRALRVRVTGSPQVCARRLAAAEGLSEEVARKRLHDVNHQRGEFVWATFGSRLNDPTSFDLTVNTDRMQDTEMVVRVLVEAERVVAAH